ncbi:unnamed protein product [Paramecium octaurelia]|uniref:Uncharacterized protein n=1 Tax=Paramecium octaurelia TaxID=43137 RepID=A0A8S1WKW1_PAROT|nr:unnamed protein product [Paramecium octaurelia]
MDLIIHNQEKADPLEFKELILIPKFKSFKHPTLVKYNSQRQSQYQVGDEIHILLHPINSEPSLYQQLQKLQVKVSLGQMEQNKYNLNQLIFQTSNFEHLMANCLFLRNIAQKSPSSQLLMQNEVVNQKPN